MNTFSYVTALKGPSATSRLDPGGWGESLAQDVNRKYRSGDTANSVNLHPRAF